mgnify:CR=1 FL=1|tara:strand:- start:60 stop:410 length:351 start_codon:yes stop_codon:yes gene_type:complete
MKILKTKTSSQNLSNTLALVQFAAWFGKDATPSPSPDKCWVKLIQMTRKWEQLDSTSASKLRETFVIPQEPKTMLVEKSNFSLKRKNWSTGTIIQINKFMINESKYLENQFLKNNI